jgi:hypothetical protein
MSIQIFPAEIFDLFVDQLGLAIEDPESRTALLTCTRVNRQFYHQASSHIFSSLSLSTVISPKSLNALRDILNVNPEIATCIRSFTVEARTYTESLRAVLRQLSRLQKFGWICEHFREFHWNEPDTPSSMIGNLFELSSLTALHFENVMYLPVSIFYRFRHLESLTLINVGFAKLEPDTSSGSPFSSLKTLRITGALWSDEDVEAVKLIMICAAPTLTTLILSKTMFMYCKLFVISIPPPFDLSLYIARFFLNLKPIIFPVLESIHMSCVIYPRSDNALPPLICQLLDYSAPMVNKIEIEFEWEYVRPDQPFIFSLANGWSSIDEILSGSAYQSLKTLELTFSSRIRPVNAERNLRRCAVRKFLKERLPGVSSRSHIEMKVISNQYTLIT